MIKLNLGCGTDIREGWINYDSFPFNDKVRYIDLNRIPLPFDDNSVDEILLSHVLEHMDINRFDFMKEIYRILKPGGKVTVKLPVYCNVIRHTKDSFSHNYMDIVYKGTTINDRACIEPLFNLVFFRKKKSLRDIIGQLKNRFIDLFNTEYTWVLEKK